MRGLSGVHGFRTATAILVAAALIGAGGAAAPDRPERPGWTSPGLVGGCGWPSTGVPLPPDEADGASYLPDSTVVRLADGRVRLVEPGTAGTILVRASDRRVRAAVRSDRAWLARGAVPGGGAHREMAVRALLDLHMLTRPNGASLASWYGAWEYTWPRDSAFAAAAFTVTGHTSEAVRILRFFANVQHDDGRWAARYHPDGTAVIDGREPQTDALGWMLWSSWLLRTLEPSEHVPELWPMVRRAADHLAGSLGPDGLPPPSPDYWERRVTREQAPDRPTLGVVGPVLAGLRSAAAIADGYARPAEAARWRAAAHRVGGAVVRHFAPHGYPRSPVQGGHMDTSVTFIAPPFAPLDPSVSAAVSDAARKLALPNGGVLPGEYWSGDPDVAWTPETALFALNAAASGREAKAAQELDWLARHATSLGVLPEKVGENGEQAGVAPLGWTASLVLLTLASLERPLPIPPA